MESGAVADEIPPSGEAGFEDEDGPTQRRRLAGVWVGAGSAVAAMVAVSWYVVFTGGGAPGGDLVGHAGTAQWLRTLPWWDWRGWSDWFYGGQAIGVNYPPLGHAWMRFTDPYHGQILAVALGLLVLLPWGALRLARALGANPRQQRAAVAAVLVLTTLSAQMHWLLSGFHVVSTFFGSWPAMVAVALGLHAVAWSARAERPVACGAVVGVAVLFNATVMPGVAVVGAVLMATSGASFSRAARWVATAGSAALAVCAWWLVPFLAGWDRLVRFEVPLSMAWGFIGDWGVVVVAVVAAAASWAARRGKGPARRLALSAGAGLLATATADLLGYLRSERWLELPLLVAAVSAGLLIAEASTGRGAPRPVRPAWSVVGVAFVIVVTVITVRVEMLPLAAWLMWGSHRTWSWSSALAWTAIGLWVPFASMITSEPPEEPFAAVAQAADAGSGGLIYLDRIYTLPSGNVASCDNGRPWMVAADTDGRIRPLWGLYRETSAVVEFLMAEESLRSSRTVGGPRALRSHWHAEWQAAGAPSLATRAWAEAMGARWYGKCGPDGTVTASELSGVDAAGVAVTLHAADDKWHRAAVRWWVTLERDDLGLVPVLSDADPEEYPAHRAAAGVRLERQAERMVVYADEPGWVWLRVPWDPWWHNRGGGPVLKGGPGHLVAWVERGSTELRWAVPGAVDATAAAVSAAALASTVMLGFAWRGRTPEDPERPRPAASAINVFADTVDQWAGTAAGAVRCVASRYRRNPKHR